MPVGCMHMSEGPSNSAERQASSNIWILVNVIPVIVVYEVAMKGLPESQPDDYREKKTDDGAD